MSRNDENIMLTEEEPPTRAEQESIRVITIKFSLKDRQPFILAMRTIPQTGVGRSFRVEKKEGVLQDDAFMVDIPESLPADIAGEFLGHELVKVFSWALGKLNEVDTDSQDAVRDTLPVLAEFYNSEEKFASYEVVE